MIRETIRPLCNHERRHLEERADERMPWPAREFSIVRSADRSLWIGIFSSGPALEPARTISMELCSDEFYGAVREEIVQAAPEEVLASALKAGKT